MYKTMSFSLFQPVAAILYSLVAVALVYLMVYACAGLAVTFGWASKCKYCSIAFNSLTYCFEK